MGIFDKAKDLVAGNPDKANQIVDKAGDLVDDETGGKYAEHVDKGQDFVRDRLGGGQAGTPPAGNPADASPAPEDAQRPADIPVEGAPVRENPPS